ncbi:uncharacterized protein PGRI_079750 [Penicillium griseofulvum]|uniref:Uncharacterized protein n=1 Tax=Penicillium patulum TaxID=5078 RepID=A0A135LUU6_PENPA|nr:uncharacterized protein PGRI_079750 [Penicillium griseofulvum]KXG52719.1 hypothetical protein PGRI_079750 [Penicillium griseofulvum]
MLSLSQGDPNTEFEDDTEMSRRFYLPIDHEGGINPRIKIHHPAPGIFIYRVSEGFNYPNENYYTDHLPSTNVNVTAVQNLVDIRNQLYRWASQDSVQWHLAHIQNKWRKRALAASGFGFPAVLDESGPRWQRSIFNFARILNGSLAGSEAQSQA